MVRVIVLTANLDGRVDTETRNGIRHIIMSLPMVDLAATTVHLHPCLPIMGRLHSHSTTLTIQLPPIETFVPGEAPLHQQLSAIIRVLIPDTQSRSVRAEYQATMYLIQASSMAVGLFHQWHQGSRTMYRTPCQ